MQQILEVNSCRTEISLTVGMSGLHRGQTAGTQRRLRIYKKCPAFVLGFATQLLKQNALVSYQSVVLQQSLIQSFFGLSCACFLSTLGVRKSPILCYASLDFSSIIHLYNIAKPVWGGKRKLKERLSQIKIISDYF